MRTVQIPRLLFDNLGPAAENVGRPAHLGADALCVPSEADGEPSYLSLDNFKCYKARRTSGAPKFERRDRVFGDGFEVKNQMVLKPVAVCTAVDLDGSGRRDASAVLACYKAKDGEGQPAFSERDVAIDNVFGPHSLTARRARTVCVPAELTVLP